MTFLTQLDVVNDMLATLGEAPVNEISDGHPLVPTGVRMLSTANAREQTKSWWFNKELTDLAPDNTGTIYLPTDTLRVDPQEPSLHYVQRGRRLYKPYAPASEDKYKFSHTVRCWLVRLVPFEDLPPPAQMAFSFAAQLDFMKAYDADVNKFKEVQSQYQIALVTLNAENIRNQNTNLLKGHRLLTQLDTGAYSPGRWPFT